MRAKRTILVLDPDGDIRDLIAEMLQRREVFDVLAAGTVSSAVDMSKKGENRIDLLLADTDAVGTQASALYRAMYDANPGFKVLFMASSIDDKCLFLLGNPSPPLLLLKPFTGASLFEKIQQVLT